MPGMEKQNVLADEVLQMIKTAIRNGENWMAYNNSLYSLNNEDVYFFKDKESALSFSESNYSDHDSFHVIHIESIADLLKQLPYVSDASQVSQVDADANGLYNREGNFFTDALIDHIEQQQMINSTKMNFMNQQNFEYLKDNIKYMGFGESLNQSLEENLKQRKTDFSLSNRTEVNKKPFEVTLNFRKSDNSDMYFLNSYHASLELSNGKKVNQTFYLNKGKGVTAKEAYNLLEGRSVFKELTTKDGEAYKAWIQLDFSKKDKNNNFEVKQFHEKYGYDLKQALSRFSLFELTNSEKEKNLIQSLQKGNIQSVSIQTNGSVANMFIEANPQYKTVNLYDSSFKRVQKEAIGQYLSTGESQTKEMQVGKEKTVEQSHKQLSKQQPTDDLDGSKKKKSRKNGLSV
jgi:hypothetical protein